MSYSIRFRPAARREFLALPKKVRVRIGAALGELARDPHLSGTEPLRRGLKGRRKYRVGDYRIVYAVEQDLLIVRVIAVGHRSRIYEDAERRS
jgi:mRNA interferase RelE/StbE